MEVRYYYLFFKYQIKVIGIDSWNTAFSHDFITITMRINSRISSCDIDGKFLAKRLSTLGGESDSDFFRGSWFDLFALWENFPLSYF